MSTHALAPDDQLVSSLQQLIGADQVITQLEEREYYSQDIWSKSTIADIVVKPANLEQLAKCVALSTSSDYAVIGRGGGMSYTSGYVPQQTRTVIIDMKAMNKVVTVNRDDMFVTVEAGCTWKALHEALADTGLRTPFWGTLSGSAATVGGSVSQNSIFWGSGQFGSCADSVVSMDVVLADGSVLSTGGAAQANGRAFFRHFGPDLTGLFTCDAGALGIKASITLRLIPTRAAKRFVSVDLPDRQAFLKLMTEIARQELATECFGFDPGLTQVRATRDSLSNDVKALGGLLKASGSISQALKDGVSVAMSGRRFMKDLQWPLHVIIEERSEAAASATEEALMSLINSVQGKAVENSIPKILRANPFGPVNNMLGPDGKRWVPVHGLVPLSQAIPVTDGIEAIFAEHQTALDAMDIITGYLFATISTNCIAIEPVFFWPDSTEEVHRRSVEASYLKKLPKLAANPEAYGLVKMIRGAIVDLLSEMGCSHLQLGKAYHYVDALHPAAERLIRQIKRDVDPKCLMNPGCLGLP